MENNGFKNFVFSLLWAMICAWLVMKLIIFIDAQYHLSQIAFAPAVINFINGFGISARMVLFVIITAILLFTGAHKWFGGMLVYVLGFAYIAFFVALGGAVIYYVFVWLTGSL